MTFWGLEGKHIPVIIKSKIIPYQEGLLALFWILPAHNPLQAPSWPEIKMEIEQNVP